jgi:hypothetical protein
MLTIWNRLVQGETLQTTGAEKAFDQGLVSAFEVPENE